MQSAGSFIGRENCHAAAITITTIASMRVVAGTLRGRKIVAPDGRATRPTTDRTREAMFNSLSSLGILEGAVIADLFAGSGALGIEALSRGAANCTFIESDGVALGVIRRNLRALGLEDRTRVIASRVESGVSSLTDLDIALVDPPYGYERWGDLLQGLEAVVRQDGFVVIESGSKVDSDLGQERASEAPQDRGAWTEIRSKRYGRTWVTFLQRN